VPLFLLLKAKFEWLKLASLILGIELVTEWLMQLVLSLDLELECFTRPFPSQLALETVNLAFYFNTLVNCYIACPNF